MQSKNEMSPFAQELLQSMGEVVEYLKGKSEARKTAIVSSELRPKKVPRIKRRHASGFEMIRKTFNI